MKNAITALTVAAVVFTVGATHVAAQWPLGGNMPPPKTEADPHPQVTITGRYQIFVSPNIKDHTFMVDTDTGRIWIVKKDHSTGEFYLEQVPVEGITEGSVRNYGSKKAKPQDK